MQDDRFEMQNNPTCTNIKFSMSALCRECVGKTGGQRKFHAVTWQSISCSAGQAAAAQSNHQCQKEDRFRAIEQENCIGRKKKFIFESGV